VGFIRQNEVNIFLKCSKIWLSSYMFSSSHRSDKGLENVAVCDYMIAARCLEAFLTGKSVHNQPVERFWRDVCQSCCGVFKIKIA